MAYVRGNPKTKKALKAQVADLTGIPPEVFSPGPFGACVNGIESVEGPHYPEAHKWYARVQVVDGAIVKVLS